MTTFLPFADFAKSAQVLDNKRLGQQRREVSAVLSLIALGSRNPVARMWAGFEYALLEYGKAICHEWQSRGYRDEKYDEFREKQVGFPDTGNPPWLGDERVHSSHRARLLWKSRWYEQFGWSEKPAEHYFWPVA
jgi:hypothetical protein